MPKISYNFSTHAATVMAERRIPVSWMERILQTPERIELDKADPELRHALGRISEQDDRILRVV